MNRTMSRTRLGLRPTILLWLAFLAAVLSLAVAAAPPAAVRAESAPPLEWDIALGSTSESASGVAADSNGVYVAAYDYNEATSTIYKYSTSGRQLWQRDLDDGADWSSTAAVCTYSGGLYVVGGQRDFVDYHGGLIRRYDAAGNVSWESVVRGTWMSPADVAADASGIYVTGFASAEAEYSASVVKFDAAGNRVWDTATDYTYTATGISVYAGGVYVCGRGDGGGVLCRHDANGNEVWHEVFRSSGQEYYRGVAADSTGVYVTGDGEGTGTGFVRKYSLNGEYEWTHSLGGDEAGAVAAESGAVYVAGGVVDYADPDLEDIWICLPVVHRFNSSGVEEWVRSDPDVVGIAGDVSVSSSGIYMAANWEGEGTVVKLGTAAAADQPPAVTTGAASSLAATSATLNGTLGSLGTASSAAVSFQWGTTAAYGNTTPAQTMSAPGAFSHALNNLTPATYHYRAVADGDGTALGSDMAFVIGPPPATPPTVVTGAASGVGPTSGTLNLDLTGLGSASSVQVSFEWGQTAACGNRSSGQTMSGTGSFSYPLSNLSPATTYYFRARADGAVTVQGSTLSFTTSPAPIVAPAAATQRATGMAQDGATLNGTLTGLGSAASVQVFFEWGLTDSYGYTTPSRTRTGTGGFSADLSGLTGDTTYHFRARAVGDDTAYGSDMTFVTSASPTTRPSVTTGGPGGVTDNSARLSGDLTSTGTAGSVTVSFLWGTTPGGPYTNETAGETLTAAGGFEFDLASLAPGTTFYYQARAVGDGTTYGEEESFTTTANGPGILPDDPTPDGDGRPVHLWVYLAAGAGGLVVLGILGASFALLLRRRPAR